MEVCESNIQFRSAFFEINLQKHLNMIPILFIRTLHNTIDTDYRRNSHLFIGIIAMSSAHNNHPRVTILSYKSKFRDIVSNLQ